MEVNTVFQVDGVGHDRIFRTVGSYLCHDSFIYCSGEHIATVVVGVFTNEVDASGGSVNVACLAVEMFYETASYLFDFYHSYC